MNRNLVIVAPNATKPTSDYRTFDRTRRDGTQPLQKSEMAGVSDKLMRYIPGEALAVYTMLDPAVRSVETGAGLKVGLWIALCVSGLFCWLYLMRITPVGLQHRTISLVALIAYIASVGGPFAEYSSWKPGFGLIAAIVISAFLVFVPAEAKATPRAARP